MGWQFTVTIPSWTQTVLQNQEMVVFYRVEVRVQAAEEEALSRTRSVLRRFSHFQKLYDKLKEELGAKVLTGKEPPSKRTFFNVNKRPDLIEQRRRDLEQWLWRLVSDPILARSKVLNKFLELGVAARLVEQSLQARLSGNMAEAGMPSGRGSAIAVGETATEISDDVSQSGWDAHSVYTDQLSEARTATTIRSRQFNAGTSVREQPLIEHQAMRMRLGLHIEQRTNVKKQVLILKQRLETASQDLFEAVGRLRHEQAKNEEAGHKVAELESRLAADSSAREAELDRLLQQEIEKNKRLSEQLEAQSSQNDLLREQLADLGLQSTEPAMNGDASITASEATALRDEVGELTTKMKQANLQLETLQTQKGALEEKYRTDLKVLAKEVKTLRRQLASTNGTVAGHAA